ncbi:hypothetical protein [Variovorax sp. PAMC 28711]|uniref:hypothetical protein n=1 Tax=Variovorax sp. PAMC 28711 TaxID=1795631 RepID=UPI00078D7E3B|nr:hypothetical protein [Variovorax sp. PAMC 28711]AMM22989.1 hypothetical protein AX767_00290 [Variovorax sp. PAMC 28711]
MRLLEKPALPSNPTTAFERSLVQQMQAILQAVSMKVNQLADGRLVAIDNAAISAPTTGSWARGDFVRNSAPAVLGTVGNQYTIAGWRCVVSGTPGTFVQCRELTGT